MLSTSRPTFSTIIIHTLLSLSYSIKNTHRYQFARKDIIMKAQQKEKVRVIYTSNYIASNYSISLHNRLVHAADWRAEKLINIYITRTCPADCVHKKARPGCWTARRLTAGKWQVPELLRKLLKIYHIYAAALSLSFLQSNSQRTLST